MRDLVKRASGASRVFVFDHTIRESGNTNLNAAAGGAAAPVPRVHCDYTHDGAPRRLLQLGEAQGRKRVIQYRFNTSVSRAIVPEKASTRRERSEI